MKKLLLFSTAVLALTVAHSQTAVYHPFPDTNAIWAERVYNIYNNGTAGETRYALKGDTIINAKNYKKIYSLKDSTIIDLPCCPSTYIGAIREQNKKVYAIIDTIPEQLLYDFNLSVGDTITYYYHISPNNITQVTFSLVTTKVDSILLLDGKYRKRWIFATASINAYYGDTIVEGIGGIAQVGLFSPFDSHSWVIGYMGQFTCFKQNDTVLYLHNPTCNRCFCSLTTGILNEEKQSTVLFSPNPFS